MHFDHIRHEQSSAAVATITLARPAPLNARNAAMVDDLRAAVESLSESGPRCVLTTGEGRGFSSGADLGSGGGVQPDAVLAHKKQFKPLVVAVFALPIPVVESVNGR